MARATNSRMGCWLRGIERQVTMVTVHQMAHRLINQSLQPAAEADPT